MFVLAQAPPPPNPEGGDIGNDPTTPIDNYLFVLVLLAFMIIYYYRAKQRKISL